MNSVQRDYTSLLVGAVRRRLWLQSGADALGRDLRIVSMILLLGGAYNLFLHPLEITVLISVALLPLAVGLIMVLFRPPTYQAAASVADNWFNGKNLVTSAWELQRRLVDHSSMEELVMARSRATASQWLNRLKSERQIRWPHSMTIPLIVALTGAFLLQVPSKGWLVESKLYDYDLIRSPVRSTLSAETHPAPEDRQSPATLSPTDRQAVITDDTSPASPRQFSTATSLSLMSAQRATGKTDGTFKDEANRNRAKQAPPEIMDSTESGSNGGDFSGTQSDHPAQRGLNTEPPALAVKEVEVLRMHGTKGNLGPGDTADLRSTPAAQPGVIDMIPAARHASINYHADATPGLKIYLARYFRQLNAQEALSP